MLITKGQENRIVVTLFEKQTITGARFLLELYNKESLTKTYCILGQDMSLYPERFNEFVITEKTSPDPLNAELSLSVGEYVYKIYEQVSDTNLNPAGLNCVEENRAQCVGSASEDIEYKSNTTNVVYEG